MDLNKVGFEFVKDWKEQELESYKVGYQKYLDEKERLSNVEEEAKQKFLKKREELGNPNRVGEGYYSKKYEDPELEKLYKEKENAHYAYIQFAYNKNRLYSDYGYDEDRWKKLIDKHFDKLQAKVETKIGKVIKICNCGGDDYLFDGEEAHCKVEVILAGGYNIQRLHTRWIVRDVWKD